MVGNLLEAALLVALMMCVMEKCLMTEMSSAAVMSDR